MSDQLDLEMLRAEAEHRIRNMVWTISEDYTMTVNPDVDLFLRSKNRGIANAVREGAFFLYYRRRELSLYLLKKMYFDADEQALSKIVNVCMDAVIYERIVKDHPGFEGIRRKAAEDFLETEFGRCSSNSLGRFLLTYFGRITGGSRIVDEQTEGYLAWMEHLAEDVGQEKKKETACKKHGDKESSLDSNSPIDRNACVDQNDSVYADGSVELNDCADSMGQNALTCKCHGHHNHKMSARPVIELIDHMYNHLVDPGFEKRHGDLAHVLDVTLDELAEANFDWQDFLKEEALDSNNSSAQEPPAVNESAMESSSRVRSQKFHELDPELQAKAYRYIELNYGRSYMKPLDQKRMNYNICRGVHEGCSLFFTDGILNNLVRKNSQSELVRRQKEFNLITYQRSRQVSNRNIQHLSDTMKQSLIRRAEKESVKSDYGVIQPRELWKIGRTGDNRLFRREILRDSSDFVVDILMDGSGSQRDRRGAVAVQGFIISEALSIVGIPHRVQSFCTCWDYTILERFREYDDPREKNKKIFEFSTSANNRDGLAIKAVTHGLLQRPEEHKILIILSDGRPNDRIVNRSVSRSPVLYVGDFAVHDTAEEVRRARNAGVAVLGVFAGEEEDLAAEKRIFGRDFAYIRNIQNFSHVVGRYLRRQLDVDL